jgi:hypothetical protein
MFLLILFLLLFREEIFSLHEEIFGRILLGKHVLNEFFPAKKFHRLYEINIPLEKKESLILTT